MGFGREFLQGYPCFWPWVSIGIVQIEVLFFPGIGGGQVYILPGILLFGGIFQEVRDQGRMWVLADKFYNYLLFWAVDTCWARENRGVCSILGEGGGQVEILPGILLVFVCFYKEVWDQGRVWGLTRNFDKDILVFGRDFLGGSCK